MRHLLTLLTTALAILAAPSLLAAPQTESPPAEPQAEFEEEVRVDEVLLDVLVTDRDGNVIVGLGPDDFVVREDGEPVEVDSATFYSSSRLAQPAAELAADGGRIDPVPEDRYFILFFDDVQRYEGPNVNLVQQQIRAGRDARRWAEENLAPADWVAVVSYDRSLHVHTDFTRDRAKLLSALERAASGREGNAAWPSRTDGAAAGPSLLDDLPQGKALSKATPRIYSAFEEIAQAVDDVRGRKNLVYFGIGFGRIDDFGQYRRDERYYPPMVRALNDANVAVYPIDVTPSNVSHTMEDALTDLSTETGGRYYPFHASFKTPLEQITEENGGYYLLSYRTDRPADAEGFQRVTVEAKNPTFRMRARRGYEYGS